MFFTISPLPETIRRQGVDILSALVESGICLQLCVQDAHWNTKGMSFGPLHAFFGEVYTALGTITDRIAERIVHLGGTVRGFAVVCKTTLDIPAFPPEQDGVFFCRFVALGLQRFNVRLHDAYARCEEMGMVGDANALQSIIEDVEKLGLKVAAHIPNG